MTLAAGDAAAVDDFIAAVKKATGARLKRTQVIRALVALLHAGRVDPRLIRSEEDLTAALAGLDPDVVSSLLDKADSHLDADTLEALKNSFK